LRSVSVTSSIYDYRYENGRRYHAYRDGRYLLPNDEAEQDRLDCHHHLWRLMIDGPLYRAPIGPSPQRVLDLGTGTGIWAIDFADEFPGALVIGTDLSPIQPTSVPPNVKFYVDDVEGEWTYGPDEKFDFVHGRALGGSIANFGQLYRRIYDNLKPGGWVEVQEYETEFFSNDDPTLSKLPNCKKLGELINGASEKAGAFLMIAQEQKQKLIDAGFEDVRDDIYKVRLIDLLGVMILIQYRIRCLLGFGQNTVS
jgi:SAM-dependent methyltransferase